MGNIGDSICRCGISGYGRGWSYYREEEVPARIWIWYKGTTLECGVVDMTERWGVSVDEGMKVH